MRLHTKLLLAALPLGLPVLCFGLWAGGLFDHLADDTTRLVSGSKVLAEKAKRVHSLAAVLEKQAESDYRLVAQETSRSLENYHQFLAQVQKILGTSTTLTLYMHSHPSGRSYLAMQLYPEFEKALENFHLSAISLVDDNGNALLRVDSKADFGPIEKQQRPQWWRSVQRAAGAEQEHISTIFSKERNGEKVYYLAVAMPLRYLWNRFDAEAGQVKGFLSFEVVLPDLLQYLGSKPGHGGTLVWKTPEGKVVAGHNASLVGRSLAQFEKEAGPFRHFEAVAVPGALVVDFLLPRGSVHTHVRAARQLSSSLDARVQEVAGLASATQQESFRLQSFLLFALGLTLVLSMVLALFVSRSISKPISRLRDAAQRISKGNLHESPGMYPRDEIGDLAASFERMRKALRSQIETLDAQVQERTHALCRAKDEAERANRAKSTFLSGLSHEIRTPMNAILGANALLEQTPLDAKQRKYLRMSSSSGKTLLDLITNLLDVARLEQGRLHLTQEVFCLAQVVEEAVDVVELAAVEKGLELTQSMASDVAAHYYGDPVRLRQVVVNVLNNAVKFTPEGAVGLFVYCTVEDSLCFHVFDTGIGIPDDAVGEIFEPFTQLEHSATRKNPGSGLGLAICRQLVEAMGGDIEVQSREGQGSDFFVTVPLPVAESRPSQDVQKTLTAPPDLSGLRVLLAEDTPNNALLLTFYLEGTGCELTTVENGVQAVQAVRDGVYDLVIMDIQMPEMDGVQATQEIRGHNRDTGDPQIPIIAMTAYTSPTEVHRLYAAGCSYYLPKPVRRADLLELLATIHTTNALG